MVEFGLDTEEVFFEVCWWCSPGDELKAKIVCIPSFKGVAKDGNLTGVGGGLNG